MNSKTKINDWDLYAITDLKMAEGYDYPQIFEALLKAGVKVVQLRDKTTPFEELVSIGKDLKDLTQYFDAQLIVNDNPYLANAIDADGVHIGQEDCPIEIARDIIGPDKILGISTHNVPQAIKAQLMDVDYIAVGPIFDTFSKENPEKTLGLEMVKWATNTIKIPIVFIGGINSSNIMQVLENGGTCCAVISAVMNQKDICQAAGNLRAIIREHAVIK